MPKVTEMVEVIVQIKAQDCLTSKPTVFLVLLNRGSRLMHEGSCLGGQPPTEFV